MKVQCDVCALGAASVFCCADEAALCDACDRCIHGANKLAGKHRRLSLLSSSSPSRSPPLCDICQERRGFVFCREDRAILCRDCDVPIHTANELTMNHDRFLLTGIRFSSAPLPSAPPPEAAEVGGSKSNDKDVRIKKCWSKSHEEVVVAASEEEAPCSGSTTTTTTATADANAAADGSNSSSISEYLIKMLPGWHVEDFLTDDATAADADVFSQAEEDLLRGSSGRRGVGEGPPIWVPRAKYPVEEGQAGHLFQGFVGSKASRQRWGKESLRVPQMHASKRCKATGLYS